MTCRSALGAFTAWHGTTDTRIESTALDDVVDLPTAGPGTATNATELNALLNQDDVAVFQVCLEACTMVVGIAAKAHDRIPAFTLDEFIADYRRQLLARDDDATWCDWCKRIFF
jgi:hypothetical protein